MSEIRYKRQFDVNGNELPGIPYKVSDEQLADEAEEKALAKADELIDSISKLSEAKVFLKRLCKRLVRKGVLP